jgi:predicted nuclease of predicted toxin-antitoxin system
MRLLIDMNLTPRWVQALTEAGHQAIHWSDIGPTNAPDRQIFEYASNHGFVIITNDMDFPQILAYTASSKPSIILIRGEPMTPEARSGALVSAIKQCADDLERGAILALHWSGKVRARLLPLS